MGVLLITSGTLGRWCFQLRKQLGRVYRQRDFARAVQFRYKAILDINKLTVDIRDIEKQFEDDKTEEAAA